MFSLNKGLHIDGVIKKNKYIILCYKFNVNSMILFIFIVFFIVGVVITTITTILRLTFYCWNTFYRDSTMFYIKMKDFTMTVIKFLKKFSHDCKNEPPYPCTPAWRHIIVLTPYNHGHKKMGRNTLHNYIIHRHIDPVYDLLNVP